VGSGGWGVRTRQIWKPLAKHTQRNCGCDGAPSSQSNPAQSTRSRPAAAAAAAPVQGDSLLMQDLTPDETQCEGTEQETAETTPLATESAPDSPCDVRPVQPDV
jgi:hypothetical protein